MIPIKDKYKLIVVCLFLFSLIHVSRSEIFLVQGNLEVTNIF